MIKKSYALLISSLLLSSSLWAQDLAEKIPARAKAVVFVNSGQIDQLLGTKVFEDSKVGQKFLKEISRHKNQRYNNIASLGIDVHRNTYFYYLPTDSFKYFVFLVPVSNARDFETLFVDNNEVKDFPQNSAYRYCKMGSDGIAYWNNNMAQIIYAQKVSHYFDRSDIRQRYQIADASDVSAVTEAIADTVRAIEVAIATPQEGVMAYDTVAAVVTISRPAPGKNKHKKPTGKSLAKNKRSSSVQERIETVAPPQEIVVEAPVMPPPTDYNSRYELEYQKIQKIREQCLMAFAEEQMNKDAGSRSILDKKGFTKNIDPDAALSFWAADLDHMFTDNIFSGYFFRKMHLGTSFGYKNIAGHIYLQDQQAKMTFQLDLDDATADAYSRIYDKRINKKFLKYINSDKLIGFASMALNTQAYLEEAPKLIANTYKSWGIYNDEIDLGTDLLSLLLDEKAISKVIKGDMLFVCTDISKKKTSYTTYDYGDNYERKEVMRTKEEVLPDFMLMFSSDDTRLLEKTLQYGVKKGIANYSNGIYTLDRKTRKMPFTVYLHIKDGIVFLSTSRNDIEDIANDLFAAHVYPEHKRMILGGNSSVFINTEKIAAKLPKGSMSSRKWSNLNKVLNNIGGIYGKSFPLDGNTCSGEILIDATGNDQDNALAHFFKLIDSVY